MQEPVRLDLKIVYTELRAGHFDWSFLDLDALLKNRSAKEVMQVLFLPEGIDDSQRTALRLQGKALYEAGQSEDVVAVEVRYEHRVHVARAEAKPIELALSSLAGVEQKAMIAPSKQHGAGVPPPGRNLTRSPQHEQHPVVAAGKSQYFRTRHGIKGVGCKAVRL